MKSKGEMFSATRARMYMQKYLKEQWRTLLLRGATVIGVMALVGALTAFSNTYSYCNEQFDTLKKFYVEQDPVWNEMIRAMIGLLYVFAAVSASMTFGGFARKDARLAELMFPASQAEKFAVRWLIYVPGFLLLFAVGLVVAESVRLLVTHCIADHPEYARFMCGDAFTTRINGERVLMSSLLPALAGAMTMQSLFMLGSIFWHKNSFVKTFVLLALLCIGYFFVGFITVSSLGDVDYMHEDTELPRTTIYYSIMAAITVFCYVVAYMRYREMDIDNRM